jgi:hypothetical protein
MRFEVGDVVTLSKEFKEETPHSQRVIQMRARGRVVGFGRKHRNTVRVKWIEGTPNPPKSIESWCAEWLEKVEDSNERRLKE